MPNRLSYTTFALQVFRLLPLLVFFRGAAVAAETAPPSALVLVLTDGEDKVLFSEPVAKGEMFSVVFTHSLALSRVEETYEVMGSGEFRLRETVYEDFGAGLPHEEMPGLRMEFGDGRIRLSGYDVVFTDVWMRIGHIADHRLLMPNGKEIRLAELRRPGTAVNIRVAESTPLRGEVDNNDE